MLFRPPPPRKRVSRPLHQIGHLRGFRRDRECARVDATRIQQVADQAPHVVRLLGDDPVELAHLCRVERFRLLQQRRRRALDGDQRCAQFMAHQTQELGLQPFDLVERRQILKSHHHRADGVFLGEDRRGVDQRPNAAAVRHRKHHFLVAHRLAAVKQFRHGELAQAHLAAVGAMEGHYLQDLLGRTAGRAQALSDAPCLAVDRHCPAAPGIEHHDSHRGGLDQGLEVGPCAVRGTVGARVDDRRGCLGSEQRHHLLVLVGEYLAVRLVGEEEAADIRIPMAHRCALEGPGERRGGLDAERADIAREVIEPQRPRQAAEVTEQAGVVGPGDELALFLRFEAREHEIPGRARLVDGGNDAPAGAGERAGAVHYLTQHGVEVETGVDAQDSCIQGCDALAQCLVLPPQIVDLRHGLFPR